jgi:hypothetical protein
MHVCVVFRKRYPQPKSTLNFLEGFMFLPPGMHDFSVHAQLAGLPPLGGGPHEAFWPGPGTLGAALGFGPMLGLPPGLGLPWAAAAASGKGPSPPLHALLSHYVLAAGLPGHPGLAGFMPPGMLGSLQPPPLAASASHSPPLKGPRSPDIESDTADGKDDENRYVEVFFTYYSMM